MSNQPYPQNRVAVVTGGASGIGEGVARLFARRGGISAIIDIDRKNGERVAGELEAAGLRASFHQADVTRPDEIDGAVNRIAERWGRIDLLSSNAGIQRYGTIETTTPAQWDEVMNVNLKSVFLCSRACIPHLKQQKGAIVVMTSVQAYATQQNVLAYTTSKHALIGFIRAMGLDLAGYGVRVNGVAPGSVNTPMLRNAVNSDADPKKLWKVIERMHPLGRIAEPEDVAEAVLYLAGPGAAMVTGTTLVVDGGLLLPISGSPSE